MRLFVALDIADNIRSRIDRFLDGVRGFAPEARWMRPESLHVTLKFIGETPEENVEGIKQALETIEADHFDLNLRGYGFFPSPRAPRVFWIGIHADLPLASLASNVDLKLVPLNIQKEEHAYNPHLTLARAAGGSGPRHKREDSGSNGSFQRLQEKLAALPQPEFGTMAARDFFLYRSQPLRGGSQYTKLAGFSLR